MDILIVIVGIFFVFMFITVFTKPRQTYRSRHGGEAKNKVGIPTMGIKKKKAQQRTSVKDDIKRRLDSI